ncbi:MAG: hypothetical protein HY921_01005 [Elusimicrobia bacterium]|nr:hypothetical protein [Elusimicrobiota bacterium]
MTRLALIEALLGLLLLAPARAGEARPRAAGSVVQSDQWEVRRSPHREEEFTGNVRYQAGRSRLRSDWALFSHETELWTVRGHVRLEHRMLSGDRVTAEGDAGTYSLATKKGALTAESGIEFSRAPDSGEPDRGRADRLDWEGESFMQLSGKVHVWGPRLEAWADEAQGRADGRRLDLSGGRPVLLRSGRSWQGAVKANHIAAWEPSAQSSVEGVSADGKAVGWICFEGGGP